MRKVTITSICLSSIIILALLTFGCQGAPVSTESGPVQRAEPEPIKYPQIENGIALPEVADYPEISADVAIQLFRDCKIAAGCGTAIESEVGTFKSFGEMSFGQGGSSNTIRVNDSEFLIIVRTKDAKVVSMTNLTATPDPVSAELSETQARELAELMFSGFMAAVDSARQDSPQLPPRDQPDYKLSFLDRNAPAMYSNAWYAQWDRVSPIPYYQQMSYLRLRPDGLFLNAETREGERCYETEAVIDETQALDIAKPVFAEEYEWHAQPASAQLAYVIPNQYPPGLPSLEYPVVALPEQNRLAWVVGVDTLGDQRFFQYSAEVWVDAITGEVIGKASVF